MSSPLTKTTSRLQEQFLSSSLELWLIVSRESGKKPGDCNWLNSRIYCNACAEALPSFPNHGAQSKLSFLPAPQGIPVLFSKRKAGRWQKRELRAWQQKDKQRENMMCNKSGTCKITMASHTILTLLGIVSTLMIFQHVTMLNHDDTGAGSSDQMQSEKVTLRLWPCEALERLSLHRSPLFSCWKTRLHRNPEKLPEQCR